RFGNQRANLRARAIFGLARPWCHLMKLSLQRPGMCCESRPPAELLRVLAAVGCSWDFPSSFRREADTRPSESLENALA
ncbi:unnamed protein product, partial [Effrenium voratum]